MRKRPEKNDNDLEKQFIENAIIERLEGKNTKIEDLHKHVKSIKWPIEDTPILPSMASGSKLGKPISISMKEYEWNTIDRHTKAIGIAKAIWIKYAVFKLLQEEQLYCFKNTKIKNE